MAVLVVLVLVALWFWLMFWSLRALARYNSVEGVARRYVKIQLQRESSSSPIGHRFAQEHYSERLKAGETLEDLIAEKAEQVRNAKQASKKIKYY